MPASKRWRNWTGVAFAGTPVDGVKSLGFDWGIQDLREAADADTGATHAVVIFSNPVFTLNIIDAFLLYTSAVGVKGIFTGTANDSYNGTAAGGGGQTLTTNSGSYFSARNTQGDFNALMTQGLTVHTTFADGVTNPVSVAVL